MRVMFFSVVGVALILPPIVFSDLSAGESTASTDQSGQPVMLYPRPATNSYVTSRFSEVKYTIPTNDSLGTSWREVGFDDSAWLVGKNAIGFESKVGLINNEIKTDIGEAMRGVGYSVYARYSFEIDNESSNLHGIKLRVKFDDGYAAFLNGGLLASKNAPVNLDWNSLASSTHKDSESIEWDEIEINVSGELVKGENVLAVHAFNASTKGSDFLLSVELDVRETIYTDEPYLHGDQPVEVPFKEIIANDPSFLDPRNRIFLRGGPTFKMGTEFINYESPHVHPIDLSPSGSFLAVVNTPDARVEIIDTRSSELKVTASIPVGIDPVTARFKSENELWVVNHISDSICIGEQRVIRTIQTGDEPADVVFASSKAYVTCSQENTIEVFSLAALDEPSSKIVIEGEDPRSLAVSPDGKTIFAAVFESGNSSTILAGGIKNGDMMQYPPNVVSSPESPYEGQNPPPLRNDSSITPRPETVQAAPEVSLIVKKDEDDIWRDGNGTDWTPFVSGEKAPLSGRPVGWDVVDNDIAIIDVATGNVTYSTRLMTVAMAMDVHPVTGEVLLVGTDAKNEIRFEPDLQSTFIKVTGAIVRPDKEKSVFDLNPHLDYKRKSLPGPDRLESIGDPRAVKYDAAGEKVYVAGVGSNNLAVLDSSGSRVGTIPVGEGPTGLALDPAGNRLYVLNRFDASVSVVDLANQRVTSEVKFFDPTPYAVKRGRRVFYNTHLTSGLGQVSCASCHLDGKMDRLAWDLGNPTVAAKPERRSTVSGRSVTMDASPMKGPMVTQTLQDINDKGPFHWRGDRKRIEDFNSLWV
jgi:YVTN family beta-propeller protein